MFFLFKRQSLFDDDFGWFAHTQSTFLPQNPFCATQTQLLCCKIHSVPHTINLVVCAFLCCFFLCWDWLLVSIFTSRRTALRMECSLPLSRREIVRRRELCSFSCSFLYPVQFCWRFFLGFFLYLYVSVPLTLIPASFVSVCSIRIAVSRPTCNVRINDPFWFYWQKYTCLIEVLTVFGRIFRKEHSSHAKNSLTFLFITRIWAPEERGLKE